VNLYKQKILLH